MKQSRVVHSEAFERDRIIYQLALVVRDGHVYGDWTCGKCFKHGSSETRARHDWEDAITEAKLDLHAHHSLVHRKMQIEE